MTEKKTAAEPIKKTTLESVNERIGQLKSERNQELGKISEELTAARNEKKAAEHDIKTAAEKLNFEEYEKAKHDANRADFKIEMLTKRYDQIQHKEYITEKESDKVIDSLKAYEETLAGDYRNKIKEPLQQLATITADYHRIVNDVEETIKRWCAEIHANYRSESATYQDGTNRAEMPQPVRVAPYYGTPESELLATMLKRENIIAIIEE